MADFSACNGVIPKKSKKEITRTCILRHSCKRFAIHLSSASAFQSYIKANVNGNNCETYLPL